jgi:cobalt-zinc-cadmium efflux system outer membrane protein
VVPLAILSVLVASTVGGAPPALPAPVARAEAAAAPLRLSREEAVARAIAANPQIMEAREQVEQARARVVEATALPDAALATTLEEEKSFLQPRTSTSKDIGLGFTFPFPSKLHLSGQVARAALQSAELALTQLQQEIGSQTAQAYDALLVALRHRDDLTEGRTLAEDFLHKTEARLQGGTAAKLDVVKAKVDVAQADNELIANERAVTTARAGLNRLLGRLLGAPVEAADALEVPPPLPGLDGLEQLALESRPEVRSLAAERAGARDATRLARQYWLPDLSLTLSRNFTAGDPPAYSTAASLTLPLFFWQHERGTIAEARHRESELTATAEDLAAQVALDVRTAYAGADTALRQAVFLRDELLPEATEAYRIVSVSYGLGGSSALDLLDAKRSLLDAKSAYTDALGAANDARAELERAVGAPLPAGTGDSHEK